MATVWTVGASAADEAPPYGHPDFYPSAGRPLGWRGDGTGAWPGAAAVVKWDAKTGENVVWRSEMPAPSFAQPVVVGEKVFTMADPNILVCVNVHDGKILWQTAIDHTTLMSPEKRKKARTEKAFIAELRRSYGRWRVRHVVFEKKLRSVNLSLKKLAILDRGSKDAEDEDDGLGLDLDLDEDAESSGGDVIMGPGGPIDPKIVAEYRALNKEQKENNYSPGGGYSPGISVKEDNALTKRLIKANQDYDLYLTDHWGEPWTSLTFATPCTDGVSLYVATLNNAVARVGLDGEVKWLVWDHMVDRDKGSSGWYRGTGIGTRFVASPALFQGKLIINHNGELRVYDAQTGKKLWSIFDPHKKRSGQFPWRPVPEGPSPMCTTFTLPDGSRLPVFTDGLAFYRLGDGHMLKGLLRAQGAPSPMLVGDLVLWKRHAPPQPVSRGAQRIKAVSREEITVEDVWTMPRDAGGSGNSDVYFDGKVFFINDVFDARTGERKKLDPNLNPGKGQGIRVGHSSPIIAGKYHYCIGDHGKAWVFSIEGGPVSSIAVAYQDQRVFTDPEWRERYAWTENKQHGSLCAQANRLFFRTKGYLWCFGDPKQAFPAPKDCPATARATP